MASKSPSTIELEARPVHPVASLRKTSSRNEWEVVIAENERKASSLRSPVLMGVATLIIGVGGFLLWSVNTSIAAASVASGRVIVDGQVKKVTLYEGGVLDRLLVKEGDHVEAGQILAVLDTTRSRAELLQLEHQAVGLEVKRARLIAERDVLPSFEYAPEKTSRSLDAGAVKNIMDVEKKVFNERRKYLNEAISIEKSLGDQLASQADAIKARLASYQEQIQIIQSDKTSLEKLFKKNLTTRTQLSEKQIDYMELQSKILETQAALIEITQKISQAKISIMNRETEFNREVVSSLQETQIQLAQTYQKIVSARDSVEKSKIRSPQSGTIASIDADSRTSGSAVISGKTILEVVPTQEEMIIEGRLPTRSVNDAVLGAAVEVKLMNSDSYKYDPIFGKLSYVAADSVTDERTGDIFFPIHVTVSQDEINKQSGIQLVPGISAELFVINGERTAISYLLQPIRDSFGRAFREN